MRMKKIRFLLAMFAIFAATMTGVFVAVPYLDILSMKLEQRKAEAETSKKISKLRTLLQPPTLEVQVDIITLDE